MRVRGRSDAAISLFQVFHTDDGTFCPYPQNKLPGNERTPTQTDAHTDVYLRTALQRGSPANVKSLDHIWVPFERRAPAPFRKHARFAGQYAGV